MDRDQWSGFKDELEDVFKTKTRGEWCEIMEGTDVCFAPVLSVFEAPTHPHNVHRGTFIEVDGVVQPSPSPRFSRTTAEILHAARAPGEDSTEVLSSIGFAQDELDALREQGVIG
jgi:alpha-methylacyl-CoA racemase